MQDAVAFTGSAATGQMLKSGTRDRREQRPLQQEADSLNFSMLGPDAAPGTEEFDLFVKEVVREMTAKAGQKCTAIRRTIVPDGDGRRRRSRRSQKRLAGVKVGDPAVEGVRMGRSPAARRCARCEQSVERAAQRGTELVYGGPDDFDVVGADAEKGAFFPTTLLLLRRAVRPHASRTTSRRSVR